MHAYAVSLGYNDWNSLDTIEGFLLDAPVLDWDDETDDDTPDFDISFPAGILDGDVVRVQYDTSNTFPSPTAATDTLAADQTDLNLGLSSLANGTYFARARVERDSNPISPWSNTETVTINIVADPPVNTVAPVISGTTTIGQTLSTTNGTWDNDPDSFTYQWKRDGSNIGSATNSTYQLVAADLGTDIICEVTATNEAGSASEDSNTLSIPWTPAAFGADLMLWLAADDLTTLWQEIAGSTQVASNGQTVGKWDDKSGDGFHLTATADNTVRPTYNTAGGLHWVTFDGSNDILRRTSALGMYAAGACSIFVALRGNPTTGAFLIGERNSASANAVYQIYTLGTDADDLAVFLRNDANTTIISTTSFADEVLDDTDFVYGFVDSGSNFLHFDNGVQADSDNYTRSGALTLNRTSLGAAFASDTASAWFAARIYNVVVVNRVITAGERGKLVTYQGAKAGLSL
jgi:hypothetical protein